MKIQAKNKRKYQFIHLLIYRDEVMDMAVGALSREL